MTIDNDRQAASVPGLSPTRAQLMKMDDVHCALRNIFGTPPS
jgi:hypothetical protein